MVSISDSPVTGRNPAFPLFNSLLDEGQVPRCPATAPVIPSSEFLQTSGRTGNQRLPSNRSFGMDPTDETSASLKPIALRDPPKFKLKRQLSIDTAERTERFRIHKKVHTEAEVPGHVTGTHFRKADEVDGDATVIAASPEVDDVTSGRLHDVGNSPVYQIQNTTSGSPMKHARDRPLIRVTESQQLGTSLTPSDLTYDVSTKEELERRLAISGMEDPLSVRQSATVGYKCQRLESLSADHPMPTSPNLFNMNEIGLTSPFLSTTPRSVTSHDNDVFTFPEPVIHSPRRVSPYRQRVEDSNVIRPDIDKLETCVRDINRPEVNKQDIYRQEGSRGRPEIDTFAHSRPDTNRQEMNRQGMRQDMNRTGNTRKEASLPGINRPGVIKTENRHEVKREELVRPDITKQDVNQPEVGFSRHSPARTEAILKESAQHSRSDRIGENKRYEMSQRDNDPFVDPLARAHLRPDESEKGCPSYVSAEGFQWPVSVTLTEPTPFSPRVVSTDVRPRFPSTSPSKLTSTSSGRGTGSYETYEEQLALLRMLEQERARAQKHFGLPSRTSENDVHRSTYGSREAAFLREEVLRRGTLRSISDIERSPNEKDIQQTREDVRNRLERSISEPQNSPRHMRGILQQVESGRDRARPQPEVVHELPASQDRSRDRMMHDVRRRLFMKSEQFGYPRGPQRQPLFDHEDDVSSSGSPYIPEELLQFLHSRHFYPENLENLKDYRQCYIPTSPVTSTAEHVTSRFGRSTSHYDASQGSERFHRHEDLELRRRNVQDRYTEHGLDARGGALYRDRHVGDIHVRVSCDNISHNARNTDDILRELEHECKDGKCNRIEDEIRLMAMDAYSKIRRTDTSPASFNQFQNEINETNTNVYNSMRVLCGIKCLCKYGRTLEDIFPGSVVFRLNCPNIDALLDLWECYTSGQLQKHLQDSFVTDDLLKRFGCSTITLKVELNWDEYNVCKAELERSLQSQIRAQAPLKYSPAIIHARSRSEPASVSKQANLVSQPPASSLSPFRERFCSDSSVELSPRRAFQEINAGKEAKLPQSPSRKFILDNVFFPDDTSGSPLTSPRRKSGVNTHAHLEQENVDQTGSPTLRQKNFHEQLREGNQMSDV